MKIYPPGKQCNHYDVNYLEHQEMWLCRSCGEVFKYDPSTVDDLDYMDYEYDEPTPIDDDSEFISALRDL